MYLVDNGRRRCMLPAMGVGDAFGTTCTVRHVKILMRMHACGRTGGLLCLPGYFLILRVPGRYRRTLVYRSET